MNGPSPTIALPVAPVIYEAARIMAKMRTDGHRTRAPSEDRGDRNADIDLWGLLGEMLVLHWLESSGAHVTEYCLVANGVPTGPDFRWRNTRFEIKSIPAGKGFLCVNERSRISKPFNLLLPVVFSSQHEARIYGPIRYEEVGRWELRKGHSPYRSTALSDLKPLWNVAGIVSSMIPLTQKERPLEESRSLS